MSSVESLSPPESVVCFNSRNRSDQISKSGSQGGNAPAGPTACGSSGAKKKGPSFSGKLHHNVAANGRQNNISIAETSQAQPEAQLNVQDSQIMLNNNQRSNSQLKKNVLVIPKKMINASPNQNPGSSSKQYPFQPSKQATSHGSAMPGPQTSSKDFTK